MQQHEYHMELARWAPQSRRKCLEGTVVDLAKLAKLGRPPKLSMRDPRFKPGLQQIWFDVAGNRSFALIYSDHPKEPKDYISGYNHLLDSADFELVNIMEINDALANAGLSDHPLDASTLPRLQMEIAWWPPENRAEVLKGLVPYIKKYGPPPVSIRNSDCNPRMLQIFWDMLSNRSFVVGYDNPHFATSEGILEVFKLGLDMVNFEIVPVMEAVDVLEDAGLL